MLNLFIFRDRLKAVYGKYSTFIIPLVHFLLAMVSLIMMNRGLGYMKTLRSPGIVIILSLISSVCPFGGICWLLSIFMLAHIFAVSMELALITAAFLLVTALLYYGFAPGDCVILILTPLMFALKIPYVVPLLVGLRCAAVSVIPMSCGVVLYHIMQYIHANAGPLTNGDSVDITQKYVKMLNGILMNRTMLLFIIAFAVAAITVSIIRKLSIDHAWFFATIAGLAVMLAVFCAGAFLYDVQLEILLMAVGTAAAAVLSAIFQFFVFNVDYTRTEYTQFEDDDYYYYVKAVPKITVAAPDPKIQKISAAKKPRQKRKADAGEKR